MQPHMKRYIHDLLGIPLVELIETTKKDANPHVRTLHNIIGNFFKPSAVLAALGGTTSIQNYVQGHVTPNQWSPLPFEQVELKFTELRNYMSSPLRLTFLPFIHILSHVGFLLWLPNLSLLILGTNLLTCKLLLSRLVPCLLHPLFQWILQLISPFLSL